MRLLVAIGVPIALLGILIVAVKLAPRSTRVHIMGSKRSKFYLAAGRAKNTSW
jgi:hypothetical protein